MGRKRAQNRSESDSLPPLVVQGGASTPSQYKHFDPPTPSLGRVLRRLVQVFLGLSALRLWSLWDALHGEDSTAQRARRVREVLTRMGGEAITVGRQIAMRLDLLPLQYAVELSRLQEQPREMALEDALSEVEAAVGQPLERVFSSFDPHPIHSESSFNVYQAQLKDGARVAVKVLHRDATLRLNTEHRVASLLTRWLAPLLPLAPEVIRHVRDELKPVLLEELDLTRAARLQRWFRREARKQRFRTVTASPVYIKLSSDAVTISGFVPGVRLSEVIAAKENRDPHALAQLQAMGIDPSAVGRRLLRVCWWSFFENHFFCEIPGPNDIVVKKGGRLAFVNLGDTGLVGWRKRRLYMTVMERLASHDVEGAVTLITQLLLPLPYIDVYEFTKTMEGRLWNGLFAMENRDSPWWERTSAAIWLAVFQTTRQFEVSVDLELVRMMQSACVFEQLAARVWPEIRVLPEFKRYLRKADRRKARRAWKKWDRVVAKGNFSAPLTRAKQGAGLLQRFNLWLESVVESVPVELLPVSKKGAYTAARLLQTGLWLARLSLAAVVLRLLVPDASGEHLLVGEAMRWWFGHWLFQGVSIVLILLTARKVMYRLDDVDDD